MGENHFRGQACASQMTSSNDGKQVHSHDTDEVDQEDRSTTDWIDVGKTDTLDDESDLQGECKNFKI